MKPTSPEVVNDAFPEAQAQIRRRDDVWATARGRDFGRLESSHLYGPEFTEFKDGEPRGDAKSCAAGERATFSTLEDPPPAAMSSAAARAKSTEHPMARCPRRPTGWVTSDERDEPWATSCWQS